MDKSINSIASLGQPLDADGERFIPGQMHGSIELEHLHRYRFASQFVTDKVVLDIASGEGYGSAYLSEFASRVIGVDISRAAVDHASLIYSKSHLEYLVGSCSAIPLDDSSVDVVVSFETIEHHSEHEAMMCEIKRVLRPGGILVISSPDKLEYSDKPSFHNPFHVKELYLEEFQSLLIANFLNVQLYGQRVLLGSALFKQSDTQAINFYELGSESPPVSHIPCPQYWVAVASNGVLPLIRGGILEQPLVSLWQDIAKQRNTKITEMILAVASPDSTLLKARLSGSWYLQQNSDVVDAGVDPYEHWFNNGVTEGRLPASDSVLLARELVWEREQSLSAVVEARERELHKVQRESFERQKELEAEIKLTEHKASEEIEAQLRTLAERERTHAEELFQLQQAAGKERAAQMDDALYEMAVMGEQHAQREDSLRMAMEEKERELRHLRDESLERQRVLEGSIAQAKLKARYEVDAQLRELVERERIFAKQLSQLQLAASQERAAQMEAARQQMAVLAEQHAQREQSLRAAMEEKERELRHSQQEALEREQVLEAKIVQNKFQASDEVDAERQRLIGRERAFAEQLSQLQLAASQERAAQMEAAQQQMAALAEQHALREQSLRAAMEEKERKLREVQRETFERHQVLEGKIAQTTVKARYEVEVHLRELVERERSFAEQLSQLQLAASQERAAQMEAVQQQMAALAEQHAQREQSLRAAMEEKERELRHSQYEALARELVLETKIEQTEFQASNEVDAERRRLIELERTFAEQLSQLQQVASKERAVEVETAQQKMAALAEQHAQREQSLRAAMEEKERELRHSQYEALARERVLETKIEQTKFQARDEVDAERRRLVERERTFAEQLSQLQQVASQERIAEVEAIQQHMADLAEKYAQREQSLSDKYSPLMFDLNNKLRAIQSTLTWRLTAPLRAFSALFGNEPDYTPLDPSCLCSVLASDEQNTAKFSQKAVALKHDDATTVDMEKQEMPATNYSVQNISAAKSIDELIAHENKHFLICAYQTFFGRIPDPQGFSYYMGRLNETGDKLAIVYQMYRSKEAKRSKAKMVGLKAAMWRQKIKQTPILGRMLGVFIRSSKSDQMLFFLKEINRRNAIFEENISARLARLECRIPVDVDTQIDTLFKSFDGQEYRNCHPDVAASGINAYEHFMRFGWREGRKASASNYSIDHVMAAEPNEKTLEACIGDNNNPVLLREEIKVASTAGIQATPAIVPAGSSKNIASYFMEPADEILQNGGYVFTQLMHYIWISRLDLQSVFDIFKLDGRLEYCKWFLCSALNEYGLTPNVYPRSLLEQLVAVGGDVGEKAQLVLYAQSDVIHLDQLDQPYPYSHSDTAGANLIGYAFGEFGMGEHVRMVARSLNTSALPFCIINQDVGLHGAGDLSVGHWVVDTPRYNANIFHVNADVFPPLYFKFGESLFTGRYNIGYWAWELSKCPWEFDVALNMVDEVWSISDFVTESFKTRSPVPVITMPLAVTVPELGDSYTKSYYGLPTDAFVFFFTFDAASYLDRKNPIAVVRAFNIAFQSSNENVHLLLKTMNIDVAGPLWDLLLEEIGNDPRITVMSKRLTRDEVLGLNRACDVFVSLHRSEGFGRCVAEAMAYGKPVIVTNYSGTRDFAMEGTACVVDYRLVPVPEGEYPFWKDQVWAEPDVEHAAVLMARLAHDEIYRTEIALSGQKYVLDNFNESVIGERYANRLREIWGPQSSTSILDASHLLISSENEDELVGSIDSPTAQQCNEISDVVSVEGWVAATQGIEDVSVYVNSEFVGKAHYGILRPDVHATFSHLKDSARSGFCYLVDIAGLSKGPHTLSVVAKSCTGEIKDWSMNLILVGSQRYERWQKNSERVYGCQKYLGRSKTKIIFSLLLRAESAPDHPLLLQTLKSIATQTHTIFEIFLVADCSQHQAIMALLDQLGLSSKSRFIENVSNDWSEIVANCRGHLVGLVDIGDVFRPWALKAFADVVQKNKRVGLVYSDEDSLCNGERCNPIFKPGWSPIFLENCNYIGRPWFALKSVMASGLSSLDLTSGNIDEHLLLKIIGRNSSSVCHIPTVLVSRKSNSGDTYKKIYSNNQWAKSLSNIYPKVSIIIPTRLSNLDLVERCFSGLSNLTDYPNMEVIIIANNVSDPTLIDRYLGKWPYKVFVWKDAFSWSGINNFGVANATGDYFLFLNDDVEPLEDNWLKSMVSTMVCFGVGVVGALLKYPNDTIQHLGMNIVNYGGGTRHLFRFCTGNEQRLTWLMNYPREVSAVTGACLLTSRKCFDAVGGFDEALPLVCNDTDFCLRVLANGFSVVTQPGAQLTHHEGVSRAGMPEVEDVARFWKKWGKVIKEGDHFTNPNLDANRDDWTVNPDINSGYRYRISKAVFEGINDERM